MDCTATGVLVLVDSNLRQIHSFDPRTESFSVVASKRYVEPPKTDDSDDEHGQTAADRDRNEWRAVDLTCENAQFVAPRQIVLRQ